MKAHRQFFTFGCLATLSIYLISVSNSLAGDVPVITSQPQGLIIPAGLSAGFDVSASGTPPLFYRWQKNGANLTDGEALTGSTTTNLSLSATTTNDGASYAVVITNAFGSVTSSVVKLTVGTAVLNGGDIVVNGGFENGDVSGWGGYLVDFDYENYQITTDPNYVKSGNFALLLGPPASLEDIVQYLPTQAGAGYLISFWLASTGDSVGEFKVTWNGSTLFDQTNTSLSTWTNLQFIATADGSTTALQFWSQKDPQPWFVLDEIRVMPISLDVPEIQVARPTDGNLQLIWNKIISFPAVGYQVQFATNLTSPTWNNLGSVLTGTNATFSAIDPISSDSQRFYRVQLIQ